MELEGPGHDRSANYKTEFTSLSASQLTIWFLLLGFNSIMFNWATQQKYALMDFGNILILFIFNNN